MAMPRSIRPAICELERLFLAFSATFQDELFSRFKGENAPLPVIAVLPKGRHNAMAWFAPHRWENGGPERIPEINICAEHLKGDPYTIANSLLHEMVHYANWIDGIKDCSGSQYHNRKFRDSCQRIGILCDYHSKRYGWAQTSLSDELKARVDELNVDESAFRLFRATDARKRAGSTLSKWTCGCTNVWAATQPDLTCNKCGKRMILEP